MSAKQVGPQEVKSLSLYDRESEWKQLEEMLAEPFEYETPELVEYVKKTFLALQEKRDSFCAFLAWLEGQQHMGEQEQDRLEYRIKRIEAARKRLEKLAIDTIRSLGPDAKGKWKRLEGQTSTLSLAKNPASVEVVDLDAIPDEFKQVTLTMTVSMETWALTQALPFFPPLSKDAVVSVKLKEVGAALKEMLPCTECGELGVVNGEFGTTTGAQPEDLHYGKMPLVICPKCNGEKQVPRQVPGAHLVTDRVRLVRR